MKNKYKLLFFAIGIAGIVFMLLNADLKNVNWEEIFSTNLILLLVGLLALWFIIYVLHAICYKIILKEESKKVPFGAMLKICATGFALNSVTPAGLIGGEPYRIYEMKRFCSTEKAASSTLTFSLFYITGHITLWLTASICYFAVGYTAEGWINAVLIGTMVVSSLFLIVFFASKKKGFILPFMRFMAKIPLIKKIFIRLIEKKEDVYKEIDENMCAFRQEGIRFWIVFIVEYVTRILEGLEYYIIIRYVGINTIKPWDGALVMCLASLIGNLIFFIPMQASTREAGMVISLEALSQKHVVDVAEMAVPIGLIYRIRDFLCILIGIALILINKKQRGELKPLIRKKEKVENEEIEKDA